MTADQGADAEALVAGLEMTGAGAAFCGELVEHLLDGFSLLTPDGVHLDVNPALCEMTGFSRDELVGAGPPHPYWPPEERPAIQAAFRKTLGGKTETFPLTFMRKSGERFPVLVTPSVLRDADGAMVSAFATVKDMTALREAEAALAESERLFRLTFDQAPIGAALVGVDFRFRRVNARFAQMTGYSVDELLERGFPDITLPDDVAADVVEVKRLAAGELDEYAREKRYVRKDGGVAWGDVVVRPVAGEDGRPLAFIAMVADVTERRSAELAQRESEERLRLLLQNMNDAVYVHELRAESPSRFVDVNERACELLGYSREELLAMDVGAIDVPEQAERLPAIMATLHEGGRAVFETEHLTKQGRRLPVEVSVRKLVIKGVPTVLSVARDISRRKAAEAVAAKAQRLLHETQEISKLGGWEYDVDTGRITWTDEVYRIHGVEPGFDINDVGFNIGFYLPEDRPVIAAAFRDVVESGAPYDLELRLRAADGRRLWVRTMARAVKEGGRVVRVAGNIVDITERKLIEEALRESETKYREVVERAADGIVMTDQGRILFANDAFASMSGHAGEELAGMSFLDFVPEDQRGMIADRVRRRLAGEDVPARYEIDLLRKDGTRFSVEASAGVITVAGAQRDLVLLHDITARKQAEQEIRRLNEELRQRVVNRTEQLDAASRELEALAYSIAHDVRAPLRTIDGFSAAVLEDERGLSDDGVVSLQRVRAAAQTLARRLDDISGLSRVSRRELLRQPIDLSTLAQAIGDELAAENPSRAVCLTVAPGLTADADPVLARVLLRELLGNAWKFTRPRAEAHVAVGALDVEDEHAFFVRDDGVGFEMRYAEHLFGAFQRMHPPGEFEGDGIGLAMVQRLVRRHSGRCWAEAEVGKGATFFFTLPDEADPEVAVTPV